PEDQEEQTQQEEQDKEDQGPERTAKRAKTDGPVACDHCDPWDSVGRINVTPLQPFANGSGLSDQDHVVVGVVLHHSCAWSGDGFDSVHRMQPVAWYAAADQA